MRPTGRERAGERAADGQRRPTGSPRGLSLLVAGLIVALAVFGLREAARAGSEAPEGTNAAAELDRLSRSIAYMEERWSGRPANTVLGGRLADRYLARFRLGAELADVRRAEEIARATLPYTADEAASRARLSAILLTRHAFQAAHAEAKAAVAADSGDAAALGTLFDAAIAAGRYEDAERALARLPSGTLTRQLREARWLHAHGDVAGAHDRISAACHRLEAAPVRPQVRAWCLTELAEIQRALAGADAAAAALRRSLEALPGYPGALEKRADIAHARGAWRRAARLYERIAADAHPDVYLRLAEVHRELGDLGRARRYEAEFLRVATAPGAEPLYGRELAVHLASRAGHAATRQPRGQALQATRRALAIMRREVDRRPSVETQEILAWVLFRHARALRGAGDSSGARKALREALAASDRARGWGEPGATSDYHRGRILEDLGRTDEARSLLDEAGEDPAGLEPHLRRWASHPARP